MRRSTFELITETSHFTALQLQPRGLLQISFGALSRWLKEHLVSFPRLIQEHKLSVVILGAGIQYEEPLRFFDTDTVRVDAGARVMRNGTRIQLEVEFHGPSGRAARTNILLCPVRIDDPESLAATPTKIEGEILERFHKDEIEPGSPTRPLPDLLQTIESSGTRLAEVVTPFKVYRHICEVADQWAFTEVPALVGAGREELAHALGSEIPELRALLARPLRSFEMELSRPYFWFQRGKVETHAYRWGDRLAVVHRLLSDLPGESQHGVIVERF